MEVNQSYPVDLKTKYVEQCNWSDGTVSIFCYLYEDAFSVSINTVAVWKIKLKNQPIKTLSL